MGKDDKTFQRIMAYAVLHVTFDIITVWTVNHPETVPAWINILCHILIYLSAILYSNEICSYVVRLTYPKETRKLYTLGLCLAGIYVACLPFLKIEYVTVKGTNSSTGPAAYVGYSLAFVYFLSATILVLLKNRELKKEIRSSLLPMMIVMILAEMAQVIWRELLLTGSAVTIVTVGFFFSLENPVEVFKQKVMTDALTGVRSHQSYERDMQEMQKKFLAKQGDVYLFAFCEINNLKMVNARFGHPEGNRYISLIASILSQNTKYASNVYRMGGDEFLVCYHNVEESLAEAELKRAQQECVNADGFDDYMPELSIGYAVSGPEYKSLYDVVNTANYVMYQNRIDAKNSRVLPEVPSTDVHGTKLNLTGLTDRLFSALCTSNDRSYPFVTNLDTGVTRISPGWAEYFGLNDEFIMDFHCRWMEKIHPEERKNLLENAAGNYPGEAVELQNGVPGTQSEVRICDMFFARVVLLGQGRRAGCPGRLSGQPWSGGTDRCHNRTAQLSRAG